MLRQWSGEVLLMGSWEPDAGMPGEPKGHTGASALAANLARHGSRGRCSRAAAAWPSQCLEAGLLQEACKISRNLHEKHMEPSERGMEASTPHPYLHAFFAGCLSNTDWASCWKLQV